MKKEEFLSKRDAIDLTLKELNCKKEQLEKEYIESNQGFPIGSKVCILWMFLLYSIVIDIYLFLRNPLHKSGFVKPKTFIYVYITVLVAMDTKYLKLTMGNGYISPAMIWKRSHSCRRMGKNEKEPTHARP